MADEGPDTTSDSPRTDDDAGAGVEGFDLLSDETRLATLRVLADRLKEAPDDPTMGFAELRRRVGRRDSGNFNYHLEKLTGRFVTRTDDGYRLAPAGLMVVAAVLSGVYGAGEQRGPVDLDDPCPSCGEPLAATYGEGLFRAACPNDHEFTDTLPPGAVEGRDLEAVVDLLTLRTRQHLELAVAGVCPTCYGEVGWAVDPDRAAEEGTFGAQCPRCGVRVELPAVAAVLDHPAVVAFFHDHAIDVRALPMWAPGLHDPVEVSTATEPTRIHVTVELEGDALTATLDDSLSVLAVEA